jgi:hypothetical protein
MDSNLQNQLLKTIDKQVQWRIQKLTAFQIAYLEQNQVEIQQVMAETGIILIYGHVEGFVKETMKQYYSCMTKALKKVIPEQLSDQHLAMVLYYNYRDQIQKRNPETKEKSWIDYSTFIVQAFRKQQLPTRPHWPANNPYSPTKVDQEQLQSLLAEIGIPEDDFNHQLGEKLRKINTDKRLTEVGTATFKDLYQLRNAFAHGEQCKTLKKEQFIWYHQLITIAFFPTIRDCLLDSAIRWNDPPALGDSTSPTWGGM